MTEEQAHAICAAINQLAHAGHGNAGGPRHYHVVENDYQLKPGFEP